MKSNVLFFEKKKPSEEIKTKEIWFYDYRTNIHHTPKNNPITFKHLADFIENYKIGSENEREESWSVNNPSGRWRKYSYQEIIERDKTNLDIFWLKDDNLIDLDNLPDPEVIIDEIIDNIESALANFRTIKESLN